LCWSQMRRCLGCGSSPRGYWDRGFETRFMRGCLS
jgi:hypothetical protein